LIINADAVCRIEESGFSQLGYPHSSLTFRKTASKLNEHLSKKKKKKVAAFSPPYVE
jgi:hypothetical protein